VAMVPSLFKTFRESFEGKSSELLSCVISRKRVRIPHRLVKNDDAFLVSVVGSVVVVVVVEQPGGS
jgi:hypothetical protein